MNHRQRRQSFCHSLANNFTACRIGAQTTPICRSLAPAVDTPSALSIVQCSKVRRRRIRVD
jgi:hypothetical protein